MVPHRVVYVLLLALLATSLIVAHAQDAAPPAPGGTAQRVAQIGQLGGPVTAADPAEDGTVLMLEGQALVRVDLSTDPPSVLDKVDLGHGALLDMIAAHPLRYVLSEEGLIILRPAEGNMLPVETGFVPGGGQSLDAAGSLVAIAVREAGLRLIGVAGDGAAQALSTMPLEGDALDVALTPDGTRAYVAADQGGLYVIDLTTPNQPATLGALDIPAQTVAVSGPLVAIGSQDRVLVLDPALGDEGIVGTYAPLRAGRNIIVDGEHAYVADEVDGIKILWLAAPDRPVQVYGEHDRPALDIAIDGEMAYVIGPGGLRILDVSNRYHPLELATISLPGDPQDIEVDNTGRVYAALGEDGVAVIDVSNIGAAQMTRRIPLGGPARALTVSGGVVYVAADEAGLAVIDVAQPRDEHLLATLPSLPGAAQDIAQRGESVYLASGEAGLHVVSVVQPWAPTWVGTLPPAPGGGEFASVTLSGKRAYIAYQSGFVVADINDPERPAELTHISSPACDVGVGGVHLYALSGSQVTIYDARATAEPVYLRT